MHITNRFNFPEPIVQAVTSDGYTKGECDYTTTRLPQPPRIIELTRQHWEHLEEDASERIYSLFGQAIHTILERSKHPDYLVERRFYKDFEVGGKSFRLGGRIDVYQHSTKTLRDYKICSRYVTNDGVKPEWQAQASINALLMHPELPVEKAEVVAIYRDWSKMAASRSEDYPQQQIESFPVILWPDDVTEAYIKLRIGLHEAAKETLPMCSAEERWRRPDKFALMKKGQKRAVKLYENYSEAAVAATPLNYIEERPGEDTRCLFYCSVNKFCSYYQSLMQEKI